MVSNQNDSSKVFYWVSRANHFHEFKRCWKDYYSAKNLFLGTEKLACYVDQMFLELSNKAHLCIN